MVYAICPSNGDKKSCPDVSTAEECRYISFVFGVLIFLSQRPTQL